jgi:hypothetical protein
MTLDNNKNIDQLKLIIWLYFFLLIFEGALRKWFLPSLATPLLLVRDPIAIWALFNAYRGGLFPKNNYYIIILSMVTCLSFATTLSFGHHNIATAVFGARIFLVHFPFMFLIGKIFSIEDVEKLGHYMLYLSIPMIFIIGLQFYSPQSAWINRGIGGDIEGSGFSGAQGFFRPAGVFSFTSGNVYFWGLLIPFLFSNWLSRSKVNFIILLAATIALIASIPLSMSRGLLGQVGIVLFFSLIAIRAKKTQLLRIIFIGTVSFVLINILSTFSFFEVGTGAFTERLTSANRTEGGVSGVFFDRFLGGFTKPIMNGFDGPFFGKGLGMGTNAGSKLLTGNISYLISEGEWGRLIGEMGFFLGLIVILIRCVFVINLGITSFKKTKQAEILPWLLFGSGALMIVGGLYGQPTSLGFSTLYGGLIVASLKKRKT